jgi:hypothetical protein
MDEAANKAPTRSRNLAASAHDLDGLIELVTDDWTMWVGPSALPSGVQPTRASMRSSWVC